MESMTNRPRLSHLPVASGGVLHEPLVGLQALLFSGELEGTARQPFPNVVVGVKLSETIAEWSFDVFACSEDELVVLAKEMFCRLGLLELFGIEVATLERFLVAVKNYHNNNPYHNWRHAFDVAQAALCFLIHFGGHDTLTKLDVLSILVALLCHDMGHPGVNNDFLVKTASDMAMLYNDQSVLENMHCCLLFKMLHYHPDTNIFASLSKQDFNYVRKVIIGCILATDLAVHSSIVSELSAKVESGVKWNGESEAERLLLMKCIVKVADISNVARKWDGPGFKWACRVTEEFFNQGDLEHSMGLDVARFNDRNATTLYKNSVSFMDYVASPLFASLGKLHPKLYQQVVSILYSNTAICKSEE